MLLFSFVQKYEQLTPQYPVIGHSFIELQTVDSTNNYATALVHAGMAQHGTVVFAHRQTAGKGQRHKAWQTGEANIAMSIIVTPFQLVLSEMFYLSMATAIAVQQFFNEYCQGGCSIKWPNDLYWRDRKAGGILIENILAGRDWKFAIIGIGINIQQTDYADLQAKAVSLKQITGKDFEPLLLAKDLCGYLNKSFQNLANKQLVLDWFQQLLYKKGEKVRLKKDSRIFEALIKEVTPTGDLVVQHATEERFSVGEVEWLF